MGGFRHYYDDEVLSDIADLLVLEPSLPDRNRNYVFEDLTYMSDFEIHKTCKLYKVGEIIHIMPQVPLGGRFCLKVFRRG